MTEEEQPNEVPSETQGKETKAQAESEAPVSDQVGLSAKGLLPGLESATAASTMKDRCAVLVPRNPEFDADYVVPLGRNTGAAPQQALADRLRQKITVGVDKRPLIIYGKPKSGRQRAAEVAAHQVAPSLADHTIPRIYTFKAGTHITTVKEEVREMTKIEATGHFLFVWRHPPSFVLDQDGLRDIESMIEPMNVHLVIIAESSGGSDTDSILWEPRYDWSALCRAKLSEDQFGLLDTIEDAVLKALSEKPIGIQLGYFQRWLDENCCLEVLRELAFENTESLVTDLLEDSKVPASARQWCVAACLLNGAEYEIVDKLARRLAEIEGTKYRHHDVKEATRRRLGCRIAGRDAREGSGKTIEILDPLVARLVLYRYWQSSPSNFKQLIFELGLEDYGPHRQLALEHVIAECNAGSRWLGEFLSRWSNSEHFTAASLAQRASSSGVETEQLLDWALSSLQKPAPDLPFFQAVVAVANGALWDHRGELVDGLLKGGNDSGLLATMALIVTDQSGEWTCAILDNHRLSHHEKINDSEELERIENHLRLLDVLIAVYEVDEQLLARHPEAFRAYTRWWIETFTSCDGLDETGVEMCVRAVFYIMYRLQQRNVFAAALVTIPLYVMKHFPSRSRMYSDLRSELLGSKMQYEFPIEIVRALRNLVRDVVESSEVAFWEAFNSKAN